MVVVILTLLLGNTLLVHASSIEDTLQPYEDRLSQINEELGTNYKLASEEELNAMNTSTGMMIEYITSMNLTEFENYIIELHNNSAIVDCDKTLENYGIMPLADESEQFYFYDKVHWFYLDTKTVTVNNVVYYNAFVDAGSGFDLTETYPQYSAYDYSYSISADSRNITVTYYCTKFLSKYVSDATIYTIPYTYTAGE